VKLKKGMDVFALKRKEWFPDERLIHIYNCRRVHPQRTSAAFMHFSTALCILYTLYKIVQLY